MTGEGGRGPNLRGELVHGNTPDAIKGVIHNGIPGTQMPAYRDMDAVETELLVRHVQGFSTGGSTAPVTGDATKGRQLYTSNGCQGCHQIGGEGSVYGPDLSRVGAARSMEYLKQSVVEPSADIPPEYAGVTVTTKAGKKLTGVRANEDTFTVQLRTPDQKFQMFQKDELQQVTPATKSLMPAYNKLTPDQLNDLLAYLHSLRGAVAANAIVDKAKGIQ